MDRDEALRFTMNAAEMSSFNASASLVFMYDGLTQLNPMGTSQGDFRGKYRVMGRHGSPTAGMDPSLTGQTNISFFDGHSETVARKTLPV